MALSTQVLDLIRDEIGDDQDFVDNIADEGGSEFDSLENIYNDALRGDTNVLKTALLVWRRRLSNMQARSFDVTKEGNWLARSQRTRYLRHRVDHYERLLRDKPKGKNAQLLSRASAEDSA